MRAEDKITHYLKDAIGLAEADKLIAQFKEEVLEAAGFDDPQMLRERIDDLYFGPKAAADRTDEK
ncbi:hypothetical protein [Streptomyces sp. AD55]|uniref:hypothetical protein n=1 Tax=Streptomyces sp. AD55 TaxID=3242895 RepID=UPI003527643A